MILVPKEMRCFLQLHRLFHGRCGDDCHVVRQDGVEGALELLGVQASLETRVRDLAFRLPRTAMRMASASPEAPS